MEAEVREVGHQGHRVEHADHDLLTERAGEARHAQLHLAVAAHRLDATVLGASPLGDVHAREHLDARRHRGVHLHRQPLDLVQDSVDAEADQRVGVARLEVDVAGALVEGVVQQVVDRSDHVLVVVRRELVVAAQLHELGQRRAGTAARGAELLGRARHAGAEAVDAIDDLHDVALARDHVGERHAQQLLEVRAQLAVVRIGERERERVAIAGHGDHGVTPREGPRERPRHQLGGDFHRVDLQVGRVRRRGDRLRDGVLVERALWIARVGEPEHRDQLRGRRVVAGRGLRAHRAHSLLQHLAPQRRRAPRDLLRLGRIEPLRLDEQLEQLLQAQRGTGIIALRLRHAWGYRPSGHTH